MAADETGVAPAAEAAAPAAVSADSARSVIEAMKGSSRMLKAGLNLAPVSIQARFTTVPGDTTLYQCAPLACSCPCAAAWRQPPRTRPSVQRAREAPLCDAACVARRAGESAAR